MEQTTSDVLYDEDEGSPEPEPTPPPVDVPEYPPPPPQILGQVPTLDPPPPLGSIEPKVVFTQDAIPKPPFGPDSVGNTIAQLVEERSVLTSRVAEIEMLLGFIECAGDLSTRVAKIERFVGIK